MSDSLQPHGLQHARLPCRSPRADAVPSLSITLCLPVHHQGRWTGFPVRHQGQMRYLPCPSPCAFRYVTREDGQASLSITKSLGKEKSRSFGLWLLIWRFGPEENDGCQSDQSHKTQRAFLSTEHSSCICAWHLGAVGVFSAYGHLQLPGGPAHQPLVAGLGMVSFYFGASSGLLACSMATALD